jgi:DNA invertase Pin-like site-specific DNA recombinase
MMKLSFCAVCGTTKDLQQHHIEPVVITKIKRTSSKKKYDPNKKLCDSTFTEIFAYLFDLGVISEDETITVCSYHHNLMHGIVKFQMAEHSSMIKRGQEAARKKGVKIGRPSKITKEYEDDVIDQYKRKVPLKKIAASVGLGVGTVYDILRKSGLKELKL